MTRRVSDEQAASRQPCTCGERDHQETEIEKLRVLVGKLDGSAERFMDERDGARAEIAALKAERWSLVEAGVRAGMEWAGAGKGRPTGTTISLPPDIAARVLAEFDKEKP